MARRHRRAARRRRVRPTRSVSPIGSILQNLPEGAPQLFVTLNPPYPPKASTIIHKLNLSHPLLNMEALAAQKVLSTGALQGKDRIWYAGAWCVMASMRMAYAQRSSYVRGFVR